MTIPETVGHNQERTARERLQLSVQRNSLQLLGKIALGDFSSNTSFDFAKKSADLAAARRNGTLFTLADGAMNTAWKADRTERGVEPDEWARQVTEEIFKNNKLLGKSKKTYTENIEFLKQLGFQEDISGNTRRRPVKERVENFLAGNFYDTYCEENSAGNLADALTRDLRDKKNFFSRIQPEAERIRKMLDENKGFLLRVFGKADALNAFKATVELRIAEAMTAFDYPRHVVSAPSHHPFFTEALRIPPNHPIDEKSILDYLAQGALSLSETDTAAARREAAEMPVSEPTSREERVETSPVSPSAPTSMEKPTGTDTVTQDTDPASQPEQTRRSTAAIQSLPFQETPTAQTPEEIMGEIERELREEYQATVFVNRSYQLAFQDRSITKEQFKKLYKAFVVFLEEELGVTNRYEKIQRANAMWAMPDMSHDPIPVTSEEDLIYMTEYPNDTRSIELEIQYSRNEQRRRERAERENGTGSILEQVTDEEGTHTHSHNANIFDYMK